MNIIISLIGAGRKEENNKSGGYIRTKYKFNDGFEFETAVFGSALYHYLQNKINIDRWYILGTEKSAWSELLFALPKESYNLLVELWFKIKDTEVEGISYELLKEWESALSQEIKNINLTLINPLDYKAFVNFLIEALPDDEDLNIILDITHGYRFMPLILSFALMYIKNFKKINSIKLYYGALDMKKEEYAPVLEIDFINELFKLATSYELYKNSGYFVEILNNLGIENTENIYFQIELNHRPMKKLKEIIKGLKEIKEEHKKICANNIINDLSPIVHKEYLEERMIERAKYFFEKKQYLKSLTLLYEALCNAILIKSGIKDVNKVTNRRQKVKEVLTKVLNKEQIEIFEDLDKTRNGAVHGNIKEAQLYIENFDRFSELFRKSIELFEEIYKSK